MLGDKLSLSLGELIRPFRISILHHNLSLSIDIFHIMIHYFCYFILSCMFCIYDGFICRSPETAGNIPVKTPGLRSPENSRKIRKLIFWEVSHGAKRRHGGEPPGAGATPGRGSTWGPRLGPAPGPCGPLRHPYGALLPFDLKRRGHPQIIFLPPL